MLGFVYSDGWSNMYAQGHGTPRDYGEAVKWLRLAAEQGSAVAQFNLGLMYDKGRGVRQGYIEAHKWYALSASRANNERARKLADRYRVNIAWLMTPRQVAEAQKLAREWDKAHSR